MHHEWKLASRLDKSPLHLTWNPDTGEIGGLGAAEIEAEIAYFEAEGAIPTHPHPSAISAKDIRHSYEQMAALLDRGWVLPPELAPHYPKIKSTGGRRPDDIQTVY